MTTEPATGAGPPDERAPAVVLADGMLRTVHAKTTHALVRSSARYRVVGVIDGEDAGLDAGVLVDGTARGIPIFASLAAALDALADDDRPRVCVIGVATGGGVVPASLRASIVAALEAGLTVVNGLHQALSDDPALARLARARGAKLLDIRKPPPTSELRFWNGAIGAVGSLRVPVLGTDCAIGKRTTALLLRDACRARGLTAEMIYTGQTGWLQGMRYGFILDATPNDFVSGQLEGALVDCWNDLRPDVMLIEGQSGLRNPSGPCGSELILSTLASGVILVYPAGRRKFLENELEMPLPAVEDEIALIQHYGAPVLAVTLNSEGLTVDEARAERDRLRASLELPVVLGLQDDLQEIVDVLRAAVHRRGP